MENVGKTRHNTRMRRLFFSTLLLISFPSHSQSSKSLWMEYEAKVREKIVSIARQSKTNFDKALSSQELIDRIVVRNPELKGKTYVEPGQIILLPFTSFPHLESSVNIHYHFYFNAHICQGDHIIGPTVREVVPSNVGSTNREPSAEKLILYTNTFNKDSGKMYNFDIGVGSYYSLISLEQNATGSQATQASNVNTLVSTSFKHRAWHNFSFSHNIAYRLESYKAGALNLYNLTSHLEWEMTSQLSIFGGFSYLQTPVINQSNFSVESIAHPQLGIGINYQLPILWTFKPIVGVDMNYLMSGENKNMKIESGVSYVARIGIQREIFKQKWLAHSWWSSSDIDLNTTTQKITGLGFALSWNTTF